MADVMSTKIAEQNIQMQLRTVNKGADIRNGFHLPVPSLEASLAWRENME
jgi:hypothetical protein